MRIPVSIVLAILLVLGLAGCSATADSAKQNAIVHKQSAAIVQDAADAQQHIARADSDTQTVASSPALPPTLKPPLADAHAEHQAASAALAPIAPAAASINSASDQQNKDVQAAAASDPTKFWLTLGVAGAVFVLAALGVYKMSGSWAISGIAAGLATLATLAAFAIISKWLPVLIVIGVVGGVIYFIEHTYDTGATTGFFASIKKFLTNTWDTVETDAHDLLNRIEGKTANIAAAPAPAPAPAAPPATQK